MVDRVGELTLHHEGLQTTFHELGDGKTQDVIELAFSFFEETEADHTADKGITFENSAGVLLGHGEENSGGLSKSGKGQLESPDLSLVLEAI